MRKLELGLAGWSQWVAGELVGWRNAKRKEENPVIRT
jgi:hypothetical protein